MERTKVWKWGRRDSRAEGRRVRLELECGSEEWRRTGHETVVVAWVV